MTTEHLLKGAPGYLYHFSSKLPVGEFFEIRPRILPDNANPITDDESGMCIGYSVSQAPGLWRIYDAEGVLVTLEEAPLESPFIDPLDIALLATGVFRVVLAGRSFLQSAARTAISVRLNQSTVSLLRGRLKLGLSGRNLKMTETAAKHMHNPGRYVPLQLQEKAIRYGRRVPDPKRNPGLFLYRTEMFRLVENKQLKGTYFYKKYTLEVIVREKDWIITHFQYFQR